MSAITNYHALDNPPDYQGATDDIYDPELNCCICMSNKRGDIDFLPTCSKLHDVCEPCFQQLKDKPCPQCREKPKIESSGCNNWLSLIPMLVLIILIVLVATITCLLL